MVSPRESERSTKSMRASHRSFLSGTKVGQGQRVWFEVLMVMLFTATKCCRIDEWYGYTKQGFLHLLLVSLDFQQPWRPFVQETSGKQPLGLSSFLAVPRLRGLVALFEALLCDGPSASARRVWSTKAVVPRSHRRGTSCDPPRTSSVQHDQISL